MQEVYWTVFLRSTCMDHTHEGAKAAAELARNGDRGPLTHGELGSYGALWSCFGLRQGAPYCTPLDLGHLQGEDRTSGAVLVYTRAHFQMIRGEVSEWVS